MNAGSILFFTSFNERSVQVESIVRYFHDKGQKVYFLSTCARGAIHEALEKEGVEVFALPFEPVGGLLYYLKCARFIAAMVRDKNIAFIHAHLQVPSFIALLVKRRVKVNVFTVRHNSDVIYLSGNFKERLMEKLICRFSTHVIAISDKVKQALIEQENVPPSRIIRINNGYRFADYTKLSAGEQEADSIRRRYPCQMLLLSPGRLIPTKRHELCIFGVKLLLQKGIDVKLLILGEGPDKKKLEELIRNEKLEGQVILAGYRPNISDYMKACDVLVMLSESEGSSNSAKEAAYFRKPVIVCENVGDFSDYIEDGKSGILLPKNDPLPGFTAAVQRLHEDKLLGVRLGNALHETVLQAFDINKVGRQYEELQKITGARPS